MRITSVYIKEQKRYSSNELMKILNLNLDETVEFIKKLKAYGVLKTVKKSSKQKDLTDLVDEEVEIGDIEFESEEYFYVITFVGILTVGNIILKCFPKYILGDEPLEEMKQILKVLSIYNSKEQIISLYNGEDEQKAFNELSVILYLMKDYYEYGIYTNQENIIETNGEGEILWDNTINETFAIINNNRPFYIELKTINTIDDEMDYFKRLHQCIITECSKKLESADLLELFQIDNVNISEESLSDFGDKDHILYRIERELNIQFVTRKQRLLKTLYTYLIHSESFEDSFGLSMYGTNSFNLIWEKICAEVFDNQLSVPIGKLNLPRELHEDYEKRKKDSLIEIIDKPIWRYFSTTGNKYDNEASGTLEPDLISIYDIEDGKCFGIFDAKYYNIEFGESKILGQPGIGDITKQYLYQLAYLPFITKHGFKNVKNVFLFPNEGNTALLKGEVEVPFLEEISDPKLSNIDVVLLPAKQIYKYYINSIKVSFHKEYPIL